jgi:hypothetical protein
LVDADLKKIAAESTAKSAPVPLTQEEVFELMLSRR